MNTGSIRRAPFRWRSATVAATLATLFIGSVAGAQATATLGIPTTHDSLDAAPLITVAVAGVPPELQPVTIELEADTNPQFVASEFVLSQTGVNASFTFPRPFPARTAIYFRATAFDVNGRIQAQVLGHAVTRSWLRIVGPQGPTNDVVFTNEPTFVWSSSSVTIPPGPWVYDLTVTNTATQQPDLFVPGIPDTTYTPTTPLQANTSYHWSVLARLVNDPTDQVSVASISSFVVSSVNAPVVTLFYHTFPDPFPDATSQVECFWFDLAHQSHVQLTIYDLRGTKVKAIVPGPLGDLLPPGAYGRLNPGLQTGCDTRVSWDGTDQRGRTVPSGVYIARFQADGVNSVQKFVFRKP